MTTRDSMQHQSPSAGEGNGRGNRGTGFSLLLILIVLLQFILILLGTLLYISFISSHDSSSSVESGVTGSLARIENRLNNIERSLADVHGQVVDDETRWRIVADSVADFSDEQGKNGWFYGYRIAPGAELKPLNYLNGWIEGRYLQEGSWHHLFREGGHPNGPSDVEGFRQVTAQPVVRQWTSSIQGRVRLVGETADRDASKFPTAQGVYCEIFKNGERIFGRFVANGDDRAKEYTVETTALIGDKFDFTISPVGNVHGTGTIFTSRVYSIK